MALLTTEQRKLQPLLNGAQTVWTGRPVSGLRMRSGDLLMSLFGIPWTGFAIFWTVTATTSGGGIFFTLWGAMFICIGTYFTLGHYFWDAYVRSRTYYALTADGSAVIFTDLPGASARRIYLPSVGAIGFEVRSDGSGSVTFGEAAKAQWWQNNQRSAQRPPAFEFIADASNVYDLCTKLQQGKSVV
jgi:hypothetical protein